MSHEGEGFRIISDPIITGPIIADLQQFKRDSNLANVAGEGLAERGISSGWIAVEGGIIYGPADYDGIFTIMKEAGVDPRYARVKNLAPFQLPDHSLTGSCVPSEQSPQG